MHKSFLLISSLLFVLSACGGDPVAPAAGNINQYQETTDNTSCKGPSTVGKITDITWRRTFARATDNVTMTYVISNSGSTHVTNICRFPAGARVDASVDVASSLPAGSNLYGIIDSKQSTASSIFNGVTYQCNVDAEPFGPVSYSLTGNCLALFVNGPNAKPTYFIEGN